MRTLLAACSADAGIPVELRTLDLTEAAHRGEPRPGNWRRALELEHCVLSLVTSLLASAAAVLLSSAHGDSMAYSVLSRGLGRSALTRPRALWIHREAQHGQQALCPR